MENQHQEKLPIDNLEKLKKEVAMAGFNDYFDRQIEERIKAGDTDFRLNKSMEVDENRIDYMLHFHVDKENRKGYLNDMDASLKIPELGEERRHTFPRYLRITAKEAYNLLKYGEATAVQKKLFNKKGEEYLSYITIDLKGNKDERNNYPLKQYHENYYKSQPFILDKALNDLPFPVKELESPVTKDFVFKSLKRGNRQQVTIYNNGLVEKAYLMVNAKAGRIDIRDNNAQLLNGERREQKAETDQAQQPDKQEEIKKKPVTEQKVAWPLKKTSGMNL